MRGSQNGERGITLFKTPSTFTPRTLLIDVWRVELAQQEALTAEAPLNVNRAAPQMEKGKKVKVMKRSTSGNSIDKSDKQTGKRAETLGDKEKAYEEARARIFGLETSPTAESSSVLPSCPDVSPPTNDIRAKEQRQDLSPVLLVEETSRSVAVIDASAVTSKIEKLDEPVKKGGRRGKNVDTTSWTGNKSIARDKFAEQADPDFARNHRYVTPAPYTNQQYAPPNHFGAGYPMGMPYGPPHGFAEYGVPMSPQHGYHDPRYGYVNNNVYGPPSGYYPPAPRIAEGMQHDESYGGYSGRLPKAASLNRGPPPPDSSNFPPLG